MEDYAELVDDGTRQAGADVLLLLAGGQPRRTQDLFDRLADHRDSSVKIAAIRQQRVVRTASLLGNVERRQDAREDGRCIKVMEIALASNLLPFHRSMRETFQFDSGALGSACYGPVGRSCPIVDADCVFSPGGSSDSLNGRALSSA